MALEFIDGSSEYLSNANAILTNEPMTMACWFNADTTTTGYTIISIGDTTDSNSYWNMNLSASGEVSAAKLENVGFNYGESLTTTTFSAGVWHHACATFTSDTLRTSYLDGGGKGTNTTNVVDPSPVLSTFIGAIADATPSVYMDGEIAEVAIWDVALSDDQVAMLAIGYSPLLVSARNLVAYWPLIGRDSPEIDRIGGFNMTLNGTPTADPHVDIIMPAPIYIPATATAVADASDEEIVGTYGKGQQYPVLERAEIVGY